MLAPTSVISSAFDDELTIIRLTRSLTDAVRREAAWGRTSGAWLADPCVTFLRAEMYARDGLSGWTYAMDAIAARRLTIWCERVRTQ